MHCALVNFSPVRDIKPQNRIFPPASDVEVGGCLNDFQLHGPGNVLQNLWLRGRCFFLNGIGTLSTHDARRVGCVRV